MSDYSALETLYTKGIIDSNPKDFINGTSSNAQIRPREDVFLPDSRFVTVDGPYMRDQIDKDLFQYQRPNNSINSTLMEPTGEEQSKSKKTVNKIKNALTSNIAAGIISTLALIISGRYILKKLHIIK